MYLTGIEKTAILLVSMNIDQASKVVKKLSKVEIEKIAKCMVNMNVISQEMINAVLMEFNKSPLLEDYSYICNKQYMVSLFKNALGEDNASLLFNKINDHKDIINNIRYLNTVNSKKLAHLIKLEHPQIISVILMYLDKNQAVNVLNYFSDQLSLNVILRIAKFKNLKNFGVYELKHIIDNLLQHFNFSCVDKKGITTVIELLKLMKNDNKKKIINEILISDAELAKQIKVEMFEFSDLVNFNNNCIKKIVSLVSLNELSIAISNLDIVIKEKILKNISEHDSNIFQKLCIKNSSIPVDIISKVQNKLLKEIKQFLITI